MISYQNILEASQKRGNKKGNEGNKTPGNTPDNECECSTDDVSSSGEYTNSLCCGARGNGKHHKSGNNSPKDIKNIVDGHVTKYNNYNKRIMMQPVILPCNHGYCQECITHMTDMVSIFNCMSLFFLYAYLSIYCNNSFFKN
jgi:hypothetical protein